MQFWGAAYNMVNIHLKTKRLDYQFSLYQKYNILTGNSRLRNPSHHRFSGNFKTVESFKISILMCNKNKKQKQEKSRKFTALFGDFQNHKTHQKSLY